MKEMIYGGEGGLLGVEDIGDGYKLAVTNTKGSHPCAYVQWPDIEKLETYDDIWVDAEVHGGFTFLGTLKTTYDLDGIWLGWDYAHLGDYLGFDLLPKRTDKKWTSEEVRQEALEVLKAIKEGKYE